MDGSGRVDSSQRRLRLSYACVGGDSTLADKTVLGGDRLVVRLRGADRPRGAGHEEPLEGLAELPAHDAVDEEVEWIGQDDEEVDVHGRHLEGHDERRHLERVADHVERDDDAERELDDEEDGDDDDQHEGGAVAVLQPPTLRLAILHEQLASSRLRRPHDDDEDRV